MRICRFLIFFLLLFVLFRSAQAQTCNANMPASTPDSQLMDNGDGTITDTATGLMWKKCLEGVSGSNCDSGFAGSFTWQTALQQPGVINVSGFATHHDWRLPNIKELTSIVEEQCFIPAINLTRFPNMPSSVVWSASPGAPDAAWFVNFYYGYMDNYWRNNDFQVLLVRGGR